MQRHKQYGDFVPRFRKTALLYSALLGIKVVGSTLCKLIILEKISRSDHTYLKDNWLDIINYSLMGEILQKLEDTEIKKAGLKFLNPNEAAAFLNRPTAPPQLKKSSGELFRK